MKTVAIVGYSNSGKSTVARALIGEAKRRGLRAAAIKVGHHHPTPAGSGTRLHDTERFVSAGADPVVFRTPDGWQLQSGAPLEARTQPLQIPAWLVAAFDGVDLLVVEGRRVHGAMLVQTVGADDQFKFAPEQCDLILRKAPQDPLPRELLQLIWD